MNLWEQVLRKIEPKLNDQVFDTWLKPTHQVSMTEDILEVEVPSSFFAEWISSHYLPMLRDSLSEIHPGDLAIRFKARPEEEDVVLDAPTERLLRRRPAAALAPGAGTRTPRYTVERFAVSPSNQFSHAAPKALPAQRS